MASLVLAFAPSAQAASFVTNYNSAARDSFEVCDNSSGSWVCQVVTPAGQAGKMRGDSKSQQYHPIDANLDGQMGFIAHYEMPVHCEPDAGAASGWTCLDFAGGAADFRAISDIHVTDYDGDGVEDALFSHSNSGPQVCLGGTFPMTCSSLGLFGGTGFVAVEFGDYNGDALPDVFVAKSRPFNNGASQLCINNGGSFSCSDFTAGTISTNSTVTDAQAFDADGDGDDDLYLEGTWIYGTPGELCINNGGLSFSCSNIPAPVMTYGGSPWGSSGATDVLAADMDNDGDEDLVMHSRADAWVCWSDGAGSLTSCDYVTGATSVPLDPLAHYGNAVDVGDMDGDGLLDVVKSDADGAQGTSVCLNNGNQTFTCSVAGTPGISSAVAVLSTDGGGAVDSDGDGVTDDVDACPAEDATGQDADGDGCIDSAPCDSWNASLGDGQAEWEALFDENFVSTTGYPLQWESNLLRVNDQSPYGTVWRWELPIAAGASGFQADYSIIGRSMEQSGVWVFWEDSAGNYYDIACADALLLNSGTGYYTATELAQVPYNCTSAATDWNWNTTAAPPAGVTMVKLHLAVMMAAVPRGDDTEIYRFGLTGGSCGGAGPVDNDGDGATDDVDCDDDDANNYPGNAEVCDGQDNNCDSAVDEGLTTDADNDGYTAPGSCEGNGDDCDDANASTFPGAVEVLCDSIDNDCATPTPDDIDGDGDGSSFCGGDCDDSDGANTPGGVEVCDGQDNDCDTAVDEGLTTDADGDGFTAPGSCGGNGDDCDDATSTTNPGAAELCDGVDNDCDGVIPADETDDDTDGQTECEGDCDDADAANYTGNVEDCDRQDNDCDGGSGSRIEHSDTGSANSSRRDGYGRYFAVFREPAAWPSSIRRGAVTNALRAALLARRPAFLAQA